MTKNRRLCCRRRPIFSVPSPTNQCHHPSRPWCGDFALCLSPDTSLRVSVSHRLISQEAGWSTSHFLLRMPPPKLQTRRHCSPRSISIVSSCDDRGGRWVISLSGFVFQLKLTFLIINSPAAAVTSADLISQSSDSPSIPRTNRYRRYQAAMDARRWVLCLILLRISHETHQLFLCCMMYLRPA
jgi:hypothetical protein